MVGTALWAEILVVTSYTKPKNMYSSRSNNCLFCCGKHDPQYHKPITFEEDRIFKYGCNHLPPFLGAAFFWAFWAALSWAFWAFCFSLFTVFLSPCFLAIWAFFLSLIYLMASSASAFLSSALAFLSLLIVSRVTPSIALFYSLLSSLFLLSLLTSVCFIFLWSLLQAVAHLNLWALSFLR